MRRIAFIAALFSAALLSHPKANAQYKLLPAFPGLGSFNNPVELVNAGDGSNRLFVLQQRGLIYVFENDPDVSTRKVFINLTGVVSQNGGEKGLLGLAFHPNYETNRYVYISYTFDSVYTWSRISRYQTAPGNPDSVLLNTKLNIITIYQPFATHNGGRILFGPDDGYLYISIGDGGSSGDPQNNAQNRENLLGKILRINVDQMTGGRNYAIPVDNPYYQNNYGHKEEIYAYGLRNVWKFSIDEVTGKIWAGDVGQFMWEEIDIIEKGKNYGWNKMEGFQCFGICDTTGRGFTRPIYNYDHTVGYAITGGYVYRGTANPGLYGKYIYGDYGYGLVWAMTYDGTNPPVNETLLDTTLAISSFGVDEGNEIYALGYSTTAGNIYKIVNTSAIVLELKAAIEGLCNVSSGSMSKGDTVTVYVHSTSQPDVAVDSCKTLINPITLNGTCTFSNAPSGEYYIRVKHRNGLETWSREGGETFTVGVNYEYDFTVSESQAFGANLTRVGTLFCFFSGDVDNDGVIDGVDVSAIANDAVEFTTGYSDTDLNGDFIVDGNDEAIADNNAYNYVVLTSP